MTASTSDVSSPTLAPGMPLRGNDGLKGEVEQTVHDLVIARLGDGTRVLLRADSVRVEEGTARVDVSRQDVEHARSARPDAGGSGVQAELHTDDGGSGTMVIPLLEERVRVGTERVESGGVRVVKRVHTEEHEVEQPVIREQVRVDRVPVGRTVEDPSNPPQPRQEGETLVIPLLEEQVVVEKRLVVREELRLTREKEQATARRSVPLRKEEAMVERLAAEG